MLCFPFGLWSPIKPPWNKLQPINSPGQIFWNNLDERSESAVQKFPTYRFYIVTTKIALERFRYAKQKCPDSVMWLLVVLSQWSRFIINTLLKYSPLSLSTRKLTRVRRTTEIPINRQATASASLACLTNHRVRTELSQNLSCLARTAIFSLTGGWWCQHYLKSWYFTVTSHTRESTMYLCSSNSTLCRLVPGGAEPHLQHHHIIVVGGIIGWVFMSSVHVPVCLWCGNKFRPLHTTHL